MLQFDIWTEKNGFIKKNFDTHLRLVDLGSWAEFPVPS